MHNISSKKYLLFTVSLVQTKKKQKNIMKVALSSVKQNNSIHHYKKTVF